MDRHTHRWTKDFKEVSVLIKKDEETDLTFFAFFSE